MPKPKLMNLGRSLQHQAAVRVGVLYSSPSLETMARKFNEILAQAHAMAASPDEPLFAPADDIIK